MHLRGRTGILSLLLVGLIASCAPRMTAETSEPTPTPTPTPTATADATVLRHIVLGGGCFWGVEAYYERVPGVIDVESGYANGEGTGRYAALSETGHAEVVRISYDATKIHLAELLDRFYRIIDVHAVNRQGNDIGTQYRSAIYTDDATASKIVEASIDQLHRRLGTPSAIEVDTLRNYTKAEDVHQDFLQKSPSAYCHVDLDSVHDPLYPGSAKPDAATLKETLDPLVYDVTQQKGTERPYSSPLDHEMSRGVYLDVITGRPLFASSDKYDAQCGWPSFTKGITTDALAYAQDESHGLSRVEVLTADSKNHLGHVFEDGPKADGGLRYCMNGASLTFVPVEVMEEEGLGALIPYLYNEGS